MRKEERGRRRRRKRHSDPLILYIGRIIFAVFY